MKKEILKRQSELFPERSILCGFRGSIAHNTYVPSTNPNSIDDIDLMCVYMAIPEHYIGLGRKKDYGRGVQMQIGEFDCVHYELRHFVKLLLKSNPTTMLLLWLNKEHYLKTTDIGQKLIDNRNLFTSKLLYKSFTKYAQSQLDKMKPNTYEGYMGVKRKALVDKFGYDCKNASHSIRLLKMAAEFLDYGELRIYRESDATMLKQIKAGLWSLEDIKKRADEEVENIEVALKYSKLPEKPDTKGVERLLMKIVGDYIYKEYYAAQVN